MPPELGKCVQAQLDVSQHFSPWRGRNADATPTQRGRLRAVAFGSTPTHADDVAGTFLNVTDQLDWAKRRVREVREQVERFEASRSSPFAVQPHPRAGRRRAVKVLWSPETTVPVALDELAHSVDDAVHSLRATLDRLVYELAIRRRGGSEPRSLPPRHALRKTAFPIAIKPDVFDSLATKALAPLAQKQRSRIRSLQPFGNPGHSLWRLAELDNQAKHRRSSVLIQLDRVALDRSAADRAGIKTVEGITPGRRYKPGMKVAVLTVASYSPDRTPDLVRRVLSRELSFVFGSGSPADGNDVVVELRQLQTVVTRTVNAFRVDFPI